MVQIRQYLLIGVVAFATQLGADSSGSVVRAPRFRPDDPLLKEPQPRRMAMPAVRRIDDVYDFVLHTLVTPAQVKSELKDEGAHPAQDVNTLGEVPDGPWYVNRHWKQRRTHDELKRGPASGRPPAEGAWSVVSAKADGVTPGFRIEDREGRRYLLKLDPIDAPELASGADMVGSKLLHALGYHTPENYIVWFDRARLVIKPGTTFRSAGGRELRLTTNWVDHILRYQPRDEQRRYRALASRLIPGEPIGPFKFKGTRQDDPNDVVPHEHRRSLRGYYVFCALLNHTDSRAINSLDVVVNEGGTRHVRHYLLDFGSSLGSDSIFMKEASRGHVYDIDLGHILSQIAIPGIHTPKWMRVRHPRIRGVGRFDSASFDARKWIPAYPNPAFLRMDAEDAFWAAKQVARLRDDDIRAVVETAEYSDPRATDYITQVLCERRDKIVEAWLMPMLAVDKFEMGSGKLRFEDLRPAGSTKISVSWSKYDNATDRTIESLHGAGLDLPVGAQALPLGSYIVARLEETGKRRTVDVYLRRDSVGWRVAGVDRRMR